MALTHITGGKFQDIAGNPIAHGYIEFHPSGDERGTAPLSQLCGGITIKVPLDADGSVNPPASIWATDTSNPPNSYYKMIVFTAKGQRVYSQNVQIPSSPDPFDLSFVIPWNPATFTPGKSDGNSPQVFGGTYIGWTLTGFDFEIPTPGTLGFTIGAGTAVNPDGTYVQAATYTRTGLTNNTIYDLWLGDDGTFTVAETPSDDYVDAPLYPTKLHVVRVQTAISPYDGQPSVIGIFPCANSYPVERVTVEQSLNLKDFVNFFWIPNNVQPWQSETQYNTGDFFITPEGRIYQCNLPGVSGTTAPTQTYGSPANKFLVQDGAEYCAFYGLDIWQGSMRWALFNGIESYFTQLGLRLVCKWLTAYPNPTDGAVTDMILSHIKHQFLVVANTRQNSFDYQKGQIAIVPQGAGGWYWQCITPGTSASSSPFTGSYSLGSIVTDGTAQFKAVYQYNNLGGLGPTFVWLDWEQDFATAKYPDSHDSYAATFATLIETYIKSTGNASWLSETSPQAGLSYYDCLKEIVTRNLTDQMYSGSVNLTNTFQSQVAPFPPFDGTYNISYYEDNAESYAGIVSAAYIAGLMGDTSFAATCSTTAENVANQIFATFYGTSDAGNSFFLYYFPPDPNYNWNSVDAVPEGKLQFYPHLQCQPFAELCELPFKQDIFKTARNFMIQKWTSYYADCSKDTAFADLYLGQLAAGMWSKPDVAQAAVKIAETISIPTNASAAMTIDEFGRYLWIKNQMIPKQNITSIDSTGIVVNSAPFDPVTVPLPPSNNVVASGTYDANFGDAILAATGSGDVTINLPNAVNGTFAKKSAIFVSKYGADANTVLLTDNAGFTRTLSSDGDAYTVQIVSGVWVVTAKV